jgi:predicted Zn-dependent protease
MALFLSPGAGSAQSQGRDYYTAGSSKAAAQSLRNVERLHYAPALKHLEARKYRFAQADLEFVLRYFPNHPQALTKTAELAIAIRQPALAEEHFRNAIALYPQYDATYVIYGTFLYKLGRAEDGVLQYKKALEVNPDSAYGHYNLGLAYADRKDYARANAHAQEAYRLGVTMPALRNKLQAAGAWKPSEARAKGSESAGSAPSN